MGQKRNEGRIKKAMYFYRTCMWGTGLTWLGRRWIHDISTGGCHANRYAQYYRYPYYLRRHSREMHFVKFPSENANVWEVEDYDRKYQIVRFKMMSEEGCLLHGNKKFFRKKYNKKRRNVGKRAEYLYKNGLFDEAENLSFEKDKTYWRDVT